MIFYLTRRVEKEKGSAAQEQEHASDVVGINFYCAQVTFGHRWEVWHLHCEYIFREIAN